MSEPKIVKRYANRKLYDTERSCYVTLDDIAIMISAGDEVQVIDNKSGEDLTSVTLAQIIFESEKKNNFMPLGLLRDLIQNRGENIKDFYRERVENAAQDIKKGAEQVKGRAEEGVKDIRHKADRIRTDLGGRIEKVLHKGEEQVQGPVDSAKGVLASTQKAFDDLQQGVEERIKGGVGVLGRELDQLRDRLAELEARLNKHEEQ